VRARQQRVAGQQSAECCNSLDYVPDEEAVKRCKYWTGWKVRLMFV
jgi:hypothetical protein